MLGALIYAINQPIVMGIFRMPDEALTDMSKPWVIRYQFRFMYTPELWYCATVAEAKEHASMMQLMPPLVSE